MKASILIVGNFPPPAGGLQSCLEMILQSDLKNSFQLIKFNTTKPSLFRKNYFTKTAYFLYLLIKFIFFIVTNKIDLIVFHMASGWGFWQPAKYLHIANFFNKKVLVHMHGGMFIDFYNKQNGINKKRIRSIFNKCEKLVVVTEKWKEKFSQITTTNIETVPNAIDLEKINHYKITNSYTKPKTKKLLFVGRVERKKGIYELLHAVKILKDTNIYLTIVGPFQNNEIEINKLCIDFGIENKVDFKGMVLGDSRFNYFNQADVFVLPSHYESFGIVILEAMAFGLPVIATNVGGIPEIIDRKNSILINKENVNELVSAIQKIHPKNSSTISENIKQYDSTVFIKRYYTIFSQLTASLYHKKKPHNKCSRYP
jgi:glycosyltransferase involved in cell wall biosynthesis